MIPGKTMRRRLPSLNALKAFEASARQESFTKAAQELCVTQGAVSQQVKALETELGIRLFRRERQRLVITDAGRAYLEVVRDAFDRLAMGTERLLQRQNAGTLTVTTSPNFAAKWLVHRLGRFSEAHPGINLRVSASIQHVDFAREDIDLAIRHGDGQWPGMHVARLCKEELFPVCSPKLLRGRDALRSPRDLRNCTLLHVNDRRDWAKWLEQADVRDVDLARGRRVRFQARPGIAEQLESARLLAPSSARSAPCLLGRAPESDHVRAEASILWFAHVDVLLSGSNGSRAEAV